MDLWQRSRHGKERGKGKGRGKVFSTSADAVWAWCRPQFLVQVSCPHFAAPRIEALHSSWRSASSEIHLLALISALRLCKNGVPADLSHSPSIKRKQQPCSKIVFPLISDTADLRPSMKKKTTTVLKNCVLADLIPMTATKSLTSSAPWTFEPLRLGRGMGSPIPRPEQGEVDP